MSEGATRPARLELGVWRLSARPAEGEPFRPVVVTGPDTCRAPFDGPAIFRLPIVLPKTARVLGGNLHLEGSGAVMVSLGSLSAATTGADDPQPTKCDMRLQPRQFTQAQDFEVPELGFSDFARFDLWVAIRSAGGRPAELTLKGYLDYLLPAESAAAYLTYVMTQA